MKKISIKEMKKIAWEIMNSESIKYGINIDIRPITFIDMINPKLFKEGNYTIDKRKNDFKNYTVFNCAGYNDLNGTIVIFLNKLERFSFDRVNSLFLLTDACYHEIRHSAQQKFDRYSYARFLFDIEMFFMKLNSYRHYKYNHDEYSFEIGANLYGVRMAREYLKNNYPLIYEKEKKIIDDKEKQFFIDYKLYNAFYFIDKVVPVIKNTITCLKDDERKKTFLNNISPILSIFFEDNGTFKRPSDVIYNDKYQELDKRIWYIMLSSLSFLNDINKFDDLSIEEVNVIYEAIEYATKICKMQVSCYEELLESPDERIIQQQDRIRSGLSYLTLHLSKYEYVREYLGSIKHKKKILQ